MTVVIDFEALRGVDGEFVIKELCIVGGGLTETWTFKPPYSWLHLPKDIRRTNSWVTYNLHHLRWADGCLPYHRLDAILGEVTGPIYVKGSEKAAFISGLTSQPVHDLDSLGCPKAETLVREFNRCGNHHGQGINCAYIKAKVLHTWYEANESEGSAAELFP